MASDQQAFRAYFNDHIYGPLRKLEVHRRWLMFTIVFSVVLFLAICVGTVVLGIPTLILFLGVVAFFWGTWLKYRTKVFKNTFKPTIVPLVLRFIDPDFKYYAGEFIPIDSFMRSGFSGVRPQGYRGEDYIKGSINGVSFELSEIEALHPSPVQPKTEVMFRGILLHATLPMYYEGNIVVLPIEEVQRQTRAIKRVTVRKGKQIKDLGAEFDKYFVAWCSEDTRYQHILTPSMIEAFVTRRVENDKKLFISVFENHFYAGIEEPFDLMEPNIWLPNHNFELMWEYLQDLEIITGLVSEFSLTH